MSTILILNSSVSGDTSVSRILVEEAVLRLLEANPGATVVHRDLGAALRQMQNWPPVRCPIS